MWRGHCSARCWPSGRRSSFGGREVDEPDRGCSSEEPCTRRSRPRQGADPIVATIGYAETLRRRQGSGAPNSERHRRNWTRPRTPSRGPARSRSSRGPRPTHPTPQERAARGRQLGRRFLVRATRAGIRHRTVGSRWICSKSRRRRASPSSCRSATAGCSPRPSPSIEVRPTSWPRTSPRRRDRGSTSRPAATRTCRTSACSGPPSGSCCSTSTTSTRPSPVRGSGT